MNKGFRIRKLLMNAVGAVLLLVGMVLFFAIQNAGMGGLAQAGFIIAWIVLAFFVSLQFDKLIPHDPDDDLWPGFARDRITEDTHRPVWKTAVSVFGMLCLFFTFMGLMLLAMLIVLTSGGSLTLLARGIGLLIILWLFGYFLIVISRRRCRLCGKRMQVRHTQSSEAIDGEEHWLACFNCKIRAVAPPWESEANGD